MNQNDKITEMHTDIKWVKEFMKDFPNECERKFSKKYVEKIVWVMMVGVIGWLVTNVLSLIEAAKAFLN